MKRPVVMFLWLVFLCAAAVSAAADDYGVSAVEGLRIRTSPDLKGKTVGKLRRGDLFTVIKKSKTATEVGKKTDFWLHVRFGDKTGWVFGGYAAYDYNLYVSPGGDFLVWRVSSDLVDGNAVPLYYRKAGDPAIRMLKVDPEATGFTVSGDHRYLAVDAGTDVIGSIIVYSLEKNKEIHRDSHTRRDFSWKGNVLTYRKITYTGNGCVLWEETVFENGKVRKGRASGKGPYHSDGGKPDPACQ